MKTTKNLSSIGRSIACMVTLAFAILLIGCGSDDNDPDPDVPLSAIVTTSVSTVAPGASVTISSLESTGDIDYTAEWTLSGSGLVEIEGTEHDMAAGYFISGVESLTISSISTGQISILLRLTGSDATTSTANAAVQMAGSLALSSVPTGYDFIDINSDETVPDYVFSGDVTFPSCTVSGSQVTFGFDAGATATIEGTMNISSSSNPSVYFQNPAGADWNGVLVTSAGSITVGSSSNFYVRNAGNGGINSHPPASMVFENSSITQLSLHSEGSSGYDLVATSLTSAPLTSLTTVSGDGVYASSSIWPIVDVLRSSQGASLTLESDVNIQQNFLNDQVTIYGDVEFTGGFSYGGWLNLGVAASQATIYMPENSAFITGGLSTNTVHFDGKDQAAWQGIYIGGGSSLISGITVSNAGSAPISSNSIVGITETTAIYAASELTNFKNNTIMNSGGYGLYMTGSSVMVAGLAASRYNDNTFTSTSEAAVSTPQQWGAYLSGNGNSYTMNADVSAIEVRQTFTSPSSSIPWQDLGGDNYYQFTGSLMISDASMTIQNGAHFKFETGKQFQFSTNTGKLAINGTAENPVLLEGSGDWLGLFVGGSPVNITQFVADYLIIDGGGNGIMTGAPQPANLVINTFLGSSPSTLIFNITNSTFRNSAGFGIYVDDDTNFDFDYEDSNLNNTFENNTSGDVEDQGDCDNDGIPNNGEFPGCECNETC